MARRRRTFEFPLDTGGTVALRSRLDTERGEVVGFAVQIEMVERDGSREVVLRFDTSHGYVHQHSFSRQAREVRTRLQFDNWKEAYTYCYRYANANWEVELERYSGESDERQGNDQEEP